jgi:ABC-type lipoprotein export system ATPase subunit
MANLFEVCDICREYVIGSNTVQALTGVTLTVQERELVIIQGRSGSGKTTLLNVMGGLDRPSAGQVLYNGWDIHHSTEAEHTEWRRREVGFVFQSFALLPQLTALENVALPLRFIKVAWREGQERAQECLRMVGLSKRAKHRALELSGGEQQRVAIARAIVNRPKVILADEPTGELDFETGMKVMELFREIVDRDGVTVCVATHDVAVSEFGDVKVYIQDGKLRACARADEGV